MPIVPAEGNPAADLWLIGRDPGYEEELAGRPFVGASGRLLDTIMSRAGINRSDCYIDNIVQTRPPGNDWSKHNQADIVLGAARLKELYERHEPRVILTFGNQALQTFLGYLPDPPPNPPTITEARGYLFPTPYGGRLIPTVHPAAVLREWVPWRPLIEWDLRKVAREVRDGCPELPRRDVVVVDSGYESDAMIERIIDLGKHQGAQIAIDIENTRDLQLSCLGVAVSPNLAYVIPASRRSDVHWVLTTNVGKVLQNGMYDRYFLQEITGFPVHNVVFDTMLAWHALMPELAGLRDDPSNLRRMRRKTHKGLRFLASIYTRDQFWKDYDFNNDYDRYVLNGLDCCITLDIAIQQQAQLAAAQAPRG